MSKTKRNKKFRSNTNFLPVGCQIFDTAGTKLNIQSRSSDERFWFDKNGECFNPQTLRKVYRRGNKIFSQNFVVSWDVDRTSPREDEFGVWQVDCIRPWGTAHVKDETGLLYGHLDGIEYHDIAVATKRKMEFARSMMNVKLIPMWSELIAVLQSDSPRVIARSRGFVKVAGEAGWQRNGGRRL